MDPSEDEGHSPPLQAHPFRLNASSPLPFLLKGFITKTELGSHRACYNEVLEETIGLWTQTEDPTSWEEGDREGGERMSIQ